MKITYCLWVLDSKTWRLISEGSDREELTRDIHPYFSFTHRNTEFLLDHSNQHYLMPDKVYCVTQMKGF